MKPIGLVLIGIVVGVILAHLIAEIIVKITTKKINKRKVMHGDNGITVELLPCPFCGTNTQDFVEKEKDGVKTFAMTCQTCGARTGYYLKPIEALFSWNATVDRNFKN